MQDIENRINAIEGKLDEILKFIAAFKIDRQLMIQRNEKIKAGVACKVAYNSDGLIVGVQPLSSADIPEIPMNKVTGLEDTVGSFATTAQLETVNKRIDSILIHSKTAKTGTKVNVDDNGFVTDVSDLLEDDIPLLSIEKIKGLREILDELKMAASTKPESPEGIIKAGIGCKIEYDNMGRVIGSHLLQEEDIPHTIFTRLNELESALSSKASADDVINLTDELTKKADKISTIPGVYHKVQVNSNGQVISGEEMSLNDLPDIPIDKVSTLKETLLDTVPHGEFIDAMNSISSLESKLKSIPNPEPVRNINDNISPLTAKLEEIQGKVDRLASENPIKNELDQIRSAIAELGARIAIIENPN